MAEAKEKQYVSDHARLIAEWDWAKNEIANLDPYRITCGSRQKAWWICSFGHSYDARISNKALLNRGCPVCSGKRVSVGVNDLASRFPDIAQEWDYTRNGGLTPQEVVAHSNKKVWWKCSKCGNSWEQTCNHRTSRKAGCPYCSGRIAIPGVNDLYTINLAIAKEWHLSKNFPMQPTDFLPQSNKKVWWICSRGHEWEAAIADRYQGTGCPVCAGRKVLAGFNDLQTTHPQLINEWNYSKNTAFGPTEVSAGSNKKAWWICAHGHEWRSIISNRSRGNHNCPICSNQKLLPGYNDLATTNTDLAEEWNVSKNGDLTPHDVFQNTSKKVWWVCRKGHEWMASPNDRSRGNGCPICSSELHTSFPEQCVLFYLLKVTQAASRVKLLGKELDVFLPEYNTGIEYNGRFYHAEKAARDKNKRMIMLENGIRVITIQESTENAIADDIISYAYSARNRRSLEWAIMSLFSLLKLPCPDVSIQRDELTIYEQFVQLEKETSVATKSSDLAREWHPTKNGRLQPNMVSYQSNIKVWWLGKCGHEWYADPAHRMRGSGCPYCCNNKVLQGFNDLKTTNPNLAKEWDYARNTDISPDKVTQGSTKKVWWKCKKGHSWQAAIFSRNRGNGCPYCSGRLVSPGDNDLLSVYPNIAKEWHPQNNGNLLPSQITSRSNKKVWWLCSKCGYEWETRVVHRANGHNCPRCAKK